MFSVNIPLNLTLKNKSILDTSNHSLNIKIRSELLKQISKTINYKKLQYIKYQNVSLAESKALLKDFVLTEEAEEEEYIPIYSYPSKSEHLEGSSILAHRLYLTLNPKAQQITLNSKREIINFQIFVVEEIKMSCNPKLKQMIQNPVPIQFEYGFLTMDQKKRLIVTDVYTTHPIVGIWLYRQSISLDSMLVYDLLYKYIYAPLKKRCNIIVNSQKQNSNFIFQIYQGSKPQTYLLSVVSSKQQKNIQTLSYKDSLQVHFGNNETSCMEFTLRDKTIMNTIDIIGSPIKQLTNQDSRHFSPEFTTIHNRGDIQMIERLKTQEIEIQDLRWELQKVKSQLKRTQQIQHITPEKFRLLRSPGYQLSSIRKTVLSDKLKQSDLKVGTSSKRNSKQSTNVKNSFQNFQDIDNIRNLLGDFQNHPEIFSGRNQDCDILQSYGIIEQEESII